jgi:hypothetical protein
MAQAIRSAAVSSWCSCRTFVPLLDAPAVFLLPGLDDSRHGPLLGETGLLGLPFGDVEDAGLGPEASWVRPRRVAADRSAMWATARRSTDRLGTVSLGDLVEPGEDLVAGVLPGEPPVDVGGVNVVARAPRYVSSRLV